MVQYGRFRQVHKRQLHRNFVCTWRTYLLLLTFDLDSEMGYGSKRRANTDTKQEIACSEDMKLGCSSSITIIYKPESFQRALLNSG